MKGNPVYLLVTVELKLRLAKTVYSKRHDPLKPKNCKPLLMNRNKRKSLVSAVRFLTHCTLFTLSLL